MSEDVGGVGFTEVMSSLGDVELCEDCRLLIPSCFFGSQAKTQFSNDRDNLVVIFKRVCLKCMYGPQWRSAKHFGVSKLTEWLKQTYDIDSE